MKQTVLAIVASVILSHFSFAHEGHDHGGGKAAPNGGQLFGTKILDLELLTSGNTVRLYPLDENMKAVPTDQVQLVAKMKLPRKKETQDVKFSAEKNYFSAEINSQGAHRYELEIKVSYKGKTETVKMNVEPQGE